MFDFKAFKVDCRSASACEMNKRGHAHVYIWDNVGSPPEALHPKSVHIIFKHNFSKFIFQVKSLACTLQFSITARNQLHLYVTVTFRDNPQV